MECSRCGEALTTFTLGGSQAAVCESCEYVGISVDHRPEASGESESWDDALDRFLGRMTEEGNGDTKTNGDDDDIAATDTDGS